MVRPAQKTTKSPLMAWGSRTISRRGLISVWASRISDFSPKRKFALRPSRSAHELKGRLVVHRPGLDQFGDDLAAGLPIKL